MRELLTQIAENGFAPVCNYREADVIAKYNVGGLVSCGSQVIGLPSDVWRGSFHGLIPSTQGMRLLIAEVLLKNPGFIDDNATVVSSTDVVSDLKSLSSIDKLLNRLTKEIEETEAKIEASSDAKEREQLRDEAE